MLEGKAFIQCSGAAYGMGRLCTSNDEAPDGPLNGTRVKEGDAQESASPNGYWVVSVAEKGQI